MSLKNFPLLSFLDADQVRDLETVASCVQLAVGERLIEQGANGAELYFLLEGQVDIKLDTPNGERAITTVSAPAVIGELELLTGDARSANVYAASPCRCASLPYARLRERIDAGDLTALKFVHRVAQVLARRLSTLNHKLSELEQSGKSARSDELNSFKAKLFGEWST